jgi:hypothetical protein
MESATGHAVRSVLILRSAARRVSKDGDGPSPPRASSFETPAFGGLLRMRIGGLF